MFILSLSAFRFTVPIAWLHYVCIGIISALLGFSFSLMVVLVLAVNAFKISEFLRCVDFLNEQHEKGRKVLKHVVGADH